MKETYLNLLLFGIILLGLYAYFRYYNVQVIQEGLTNQSSSNGIASNSKTFLENIKQKNILLKEKFNVSNSEYRKNYEDIILALDDYINFTMLDQILNIPVNSNDKQKNLEKIINLGKINETRIALNNVLKFVDKQ
jgi:hypothetical protein